MMFLCLPSLSFAQDTLLLWSGRHKPVFISRMAEYHVIYSRKSDSNHEFSIRKDRIMHIKNADSTKDWEQEIYGVEAYGALPTTVNGIDSLAHKHVARFYHGGHVLGSRTLTATLIATPLYGIPYAFVQLSKPVKGDQLGMMGNPHQNNPVYLASYETHAKRQNQARIAGNAFLGTFLILLPVGIVLTAMQGMSFGGGF
ncbi:MAG: hypothetical protein ACU4F9_06680 [Arcticibacter sp.]